MKNPIAIALFGVMLMGAEPITLASTSQAFADRVARIGQRMTSAQGQRLLAPGQQTLLQAELAAAQHANDVRGANAGAMLDVIDRQLTQVDHLLSRAIDGRVLVVRTGESVMVAMNDPYIYNLELSNAGALAARPGIMWARGVQGMYIAKTPATVTLTLTPRPGTAPVPPPDMQAPVVFTIVILPRAT